MTVTFVALHDGDNLKVAQIDSSADADVAGTWTFPTAFTTTVPASVFHAWVVGRGTPGTLAVWSLGTAAADATSATVAATAAVGSSGTDAGRLYVSRLTGPSFA